MTSCIHTLQKGLVGVEILTVLRFPDPRLKLVAQPVIRFDDSLGQTCANMLQTMYAANGIGLAATQVNIQQQILVVDLSAANNQPLVIINPTIMNKAGSIIWEEGCLSFPGIYAKVKRSEKINLEFYDPQGQRQNMSVEGLLAICIQHEIDHLNGITFVDHLSPLRKKLLRNKLDKISQES